MKPVTPCPDPVPDITICVGEPARGLDPGSVGTGVAQAGGAARTAIAATAITVRAFRVRKRGTMRHTNRKLAQRPFLISGVGHLERSGRDHPCAGARDPRAAIRVPVVGKVTTSNDTGSIENRASTSRRQFVLVDDPPVDKCSAISLAVIQPVSPAGSPT